MLFNSMTFAVFLLTVFLLYWFVFGKHLRAQNLLVLISSYIFYGWWDWRFLTLIVFSSIMDYSVGLWMERSDSDKTRKLLLLISLTGNLGLLGFFKYYNFFIDNFIHLFHLFGIESNVRTLQIILPVGISFYTFQTLSYTIDIYRRKIQPTKDVIAFFAFVSFFPQLVAGPIERAKNLLPQFYKNRAFEMQAAKDGLRQILWGLFKKVVVADTCARQVDYIFSNGTHLPGSVLAVGVVFFAFQIYCDFSGYSDIAIGTARLFGFRLMRNFAYPYFSRDIAEFWRRWHISLSTWFRDYVYIPLGGSHGRRIVHLRNLIVTFVVSGFWHGANWTFLVWGLLNGLYYIPLLLLDKQKVHTDTVAENRRLPSLKEWAQMTATFLFTLFAWIFFRAENVKQAFQYIGRIFSPSFFVFPEVDKVCLLLIAVLILAEWVQRRKAHVLAIENLPPALRWVIYLLVSHSIYLFFETQQTFIYFQF